jgi:DNA-binding NarL/FixJ family response regulator
MIGAGVRGFIDTSSTHEVLNAAIDEVYNGGYWVGRKALQQLIKNAVEMENIVEQGIRNKIESVQDDLTKREAEVLRCVLDGMATKNIAHELCISEQSVKLYLGRMFKKFDVSNRSQLILMAFQRVCPANNMIQLFRRSLDKKRIQKGEKPLIKDPLAAM